MLVDGELSTKDAVLAREHLEICWNCRSDLEMVEETISEFMDFRKKVQLPLVPAPPKSWGGFSSSMEDVRSELAAPTRSRFRLSDASPFQLRLGIASISLILIGVLIIQLIVVRPISAGELFERSRNSQNLKLAATSQPVIYQKFRSRVGDGKEIDWELWFDSTNPRVKRSGGTKALELKELNDLNSILEENRIDPNRPLDAASYKTWHDSVPLKSDEVIGGDPITLKTTNTGTSKDRQIKQATLKFRANDHHLFEGTFVISTPSGERTLSITEVAFEVVSLAKLEPNFFDGATELTKTTVNRDGRLENSPEPEPEPESNSNIASLPANTSPSSIATADLEIEVLRLLSSAGADMGDEVNVKREKGVLYVRGLVETSARKDEILSALQSVRQNPAVRIELETVAEGLAKKKQPSGTPTSIENLETDGLESAVQSELIQRFGSEAEARRFSSRVVSLSGRAMSRVYALRRLSRQFSPAELKALSPEARAKWLALVQSHANGFSSDSDSISNEIGNAFGSSAASGSAGMSVNSIEDIARAVESLFQIASANDRTIRSALTISAGGAKFSALRSEQFWRSLRSADALASRIASVK